MFLSTERQISDSADGNFGTLANLAARRLAKASKTTKLKKSSLLQHGMAGQFVSSCYGQV